MKLRTATGNTIKDVLRRRPSTATSQRNRNVSPPNLLSSTRKKPTRTSDKVLRLKVMLETSRGKFSATASHDFRSKDSRNRRVAKLRNDMKAMENFVLNNEKPANPQYYREAQVEGYPLQLGLASFVPPKHLSPDELKLIQRQQVDRIQQSPSVAFSPWGQSTKEGLKFARLDPPGRREDVGRLGGEKDGGTSDAAYKTEDGDGLFGYDREADLSFQASTFDSDGLADAARRAAADYVLDEDREYYSQRHEGERTDKYVQERQTAIVENLPLGHTAKLSYGAGEDSRGIIREINDSKNKVVYHHTHESPYADEVVATEAKEHDASELKIREWGDAAARRSNQARDVGDRGYPKAKTRQAVQMSVGTGNISARGKKSKTKDSSISSTVRREWRMRPMSAKLRRHKAISKRATLRTRNTRNEQLKIGVSGTKNGIYNNRSKPIRNNIFHTVANARPKSAVKSSSRSSGNFVYHTSTRESEQKTNASFGIMSMMTGRAGLNHSPQKASLQKRPMSAPRVRSKQASRRQTSRSKHTTMVGLCVY